ncbi:unnamed protein product [Schistosoma rodhaini]|uniref:Uncharacterized protein n=1 Tax=Schistosoma rodhaini TaxID=6188 RepID=A0AA85EWK6_9TREM|nr:unnamed protein product [Schistosoma rodhaini]
MYTERSTKAVLSKTLLILIWLHEQGQFVFGFKRSINYDMFGIKNGEIMKSSMICINQNIYGCSRNSDLKFNDSILFQNNKSTHDCALFSMDMNQDLSHGVKECINIFINNMNSTGNTKQYQIKLKNQKAVKLLVSKNVIFENLLTISDIFQSSLINETASALKFHSIRNSGIHVNVELSELNLYPIYEDINYDGVNDVILNASPGTYAFRLKQPLLQIANQFCRYPLPSRYLLSLKAFRRRQTYGYKRSCREPTQTSTILCQTDEHINYHGDEKRKTYFYERSLNDQCGRNLAAILSDEPNSFYCTRDTPLINEIFGEYVNEQIVQSHTSSCDTYEKLCSKCFNRMTENSKCNSKYMNMNEFSEISVNYDEGERTVTDAKCCGLSCYNTPVCLSYYSSRCQSNKTKNITLEDKVCMDGNTFQISITPEFDFHNGTFMCHLKRTNYSHGFRLKFSIDLSELIKQKISDNYVNTRTVLSIESQHNFGTYEKYKLNINALDVEILVDEPNRSMLRSFKEVILMGRKVKKYNAYEFFVHKPPSASGIKSIQSSVEHVLHTDSAFTTIQSNKPHAFSSINWKHKGCDLDIFQNIKVTKALSEFLSKGYPVEIFPASNVKTNTPRSMSDKEDNVYSNILHRFRLNDKHATLPRANIKLSGNHSVLRSIFCNNENFSANFKLHTITEGKSIGQFRITRKVIEASVKFVTNSLGQEILHIFVTGYVTGTPAYINFKLIWPANSLILSNHDVVVLNSQTKDYFRPNKKIESFQLTYQIDINSINEIPFKTLFSSSFQPTLIFDLIIQECDANVGLRIYTPLFSNRKKDKMLQGGVVKGSMVSIHSNKSTVEESSHWVMFSPLLFITIGISLLYFLVLIIFVYIKHCIISNKGYPISVEYQKQISNNHYGNDLQYHQLLLHPFPIKLNNRTLYYTTSRKGGDYIQTFPPTRQTLYHPTIVAKHPYHNYGNESQSSYRKFSSNSTWLNHNTWNTNNSQIKRIFLFTHLAFRVFYTFLFTFSVAVSLIFSLQPSGRISTFDNILQWPKINRESIEFNSLHNSMHRPSQISVLTTSSLPMHETEIDQIHLVGPILRLQAEVHWIEEFTEQELKRQLDYVERMKLACQHAMTVELTDALREGRHLVNTRLEKWQFNSSSQNTDTLNDSTLRSVNELANIHFNRQRTLFDHLYEQMSRKLDFRGSESYKNYANMLNSVFHSGWLQYVKRMLNTSDNLEKNPRHFSNHKVHTETKLNFHDSMRRYYEFGQQRSGIKAPYVALMNYMNFYQADAVHLLPIQLLENLKKVFSSPNHYRSLFHLSPEASSHPMNSESNFKANHQVNSFKTLQNQKTQQERVFLTTNDLEEYTDGTISSVSDKSTQYFFNEQNTLFSENFIQYIKDNSQQNVQNHSNYPSRHPMLPVMTLTHIRLSLLILDCFIIAYRFFHTYEILKAFWTGQTLFVDASSWLERQTHTTVDNERDNGNFHEASKTTVEPFDSHSCRRFSEKGKYLESNLSDFNETPNNRFSRIALFQCLPQHQNLFECRHEKQALYQPSMYSSGIPRNSQSSETTSSSILSNQVTDSQSKNKSKQYFHLNSLCDHSTQNPSDALPDRSLIPIGPPLCLPPSSSFSIEQNTGCILGIRSACCRKSHYISSVIGFTVIVLLFGLVLVQMYKPHVATPNKISPPTSTYSKQSSSQVSANEIPYLSTPIGFFLPYYELLIRDHSNRLNEDWLEWTKRNELAMRGRVLNYLSRFKHELNYLDQQMDTENSVVQSLLSQVESSSPIIKSEKSHSKPTNYPTSPIFNSEFLFRQQICHFLPVTSVPINEENISLNKEGIITSLNKKIRPNNIKRIIWTSAISTFVDFDWNSEEQANNLFITAVIVGIVMISCIGIVDIGGKILKILYINPTVSMFDIKKWKSHSKASSNTEEPMDYVRIIENIILISPQPAPIIPWPTKRLLNMNSQLNPTNRQKLSPESSVSVIKEPENQIPLTAFYLDSNLVLTPNNTTPIINNKTVQLDDISHSVPVFIAHSPSSTPVIALKTDSWASTNQLSGIFFEKT